MGIILPIGIIYFLGLFDFDKITNPKQIEESIEIPILGELSFHKSDSQLVISQGKLNTAIGEQFRLIRTNLGYLYNMNNYSKDGTGIVTLFTSSTSGEGKSFVSSNLAITMAYSSKKTILLEMDLRKPKIATIFGMSNESPGISNYLNDSHVEIEELIHATDIPNLYLMKCGTSLSNPSELLEGDRLQELLLELRKTYQHIIIDTPPIHLVTDALIIAKYVDVSLYIIRQGYTQKDELAFIKSANLQNRFPKLNFIFNGIKRVKYGYGYDYNSGYYTAVN